MRGIPADSTASQGAWMMLNGMAYVFQNTAIIEGRMMTKEERDACDADLANTIQAMCWDRFSGILPGAVMQYE